MVKHLSRLRSRRAPRAPTLSRLELGNLRGSKRHAARCSPATLDRERSVGPIRSRLLFGSGRPLIVEIHRCGRYAAARLQIVDVVERGCFVLQIAFVLASRRVEHRFHGAVAFTMTPDQKQQP